MVGAIPTPGKANLTINDRGYRVSLKTQDTAIFYA
jgi:hypothetical protein